MQMNRKAYEEFSQKLKVLKTVKRGEISKAIGEAREHGDLKENAAYHEAKKDQSLNEMMIKDLEEKLTDVDVVDDDGKPKDHVSMGCTVKLKDLGNNSTRECIIVSELEADVFENKISVDSPLGNAIINCKVKDVCEVEAPRGIIKYQILEIK